MKMKSDIKKSIYVMIVFMTFILSVHGLAAYYGVITYGQFGDIFYFCIGTLFGALLIAKYT